MTLNLKSLRSLAALPVKGLGWAILTNARLYGLQKEVERLVCERQRLDQELLKVQETLHRERDTRTYVLAEHTAKLLEANQEITRLSSEVRMRSRQRDDAELERDDWQDRHGVVERRAEKAEAGLRGLREAAEQAPHGICGSGGKACASTMPWVGACDCWKAAALAAAEPPPCPGCAERDDRCEAQDARLDALEADRARLLALIDEALDWRRGVTDRAQHMAAILRRAREGQPAPASVADVIIRRVGSIPEALEVDIEAAFWSFDAERKRTGAERDAFKHQMRALARCVMRSTVDPVPSEKVRIAPCQHCGTPTELACADCAIDKRAQTHVCNVCAGRHHCQPAPQSAWRPVTETEPPIGFPVMVAWIRDGQPVAAAVAVRAAGGDWHEQGETISRPTHWMPPLPTRDQPAVPCAGCAERDQEIERANQEVRTRARQRDNAEAERDQERQRAETFLAAIRAYLATPGDDRAILRAALDGERSPAPGHADLLALVRDLAALPLDTQVSYPLQHRARALLGEQRQETGARLPSIDLSGDDATEDMDSIVPNGAQGGAVAKRRKEAQTQAAEDPWAVVRREAQAAVDLVSFDEAVKHKSPLWSALMALSEAVKQRGRMQSDKPAALRALDAAEKAARDAGLYRLSMVPANTAIDDRYAPLGKRLIACRKALEALP